MKYLLFLLVFSFQIHAEDHLCGTSDPGIRPPSDCPNKKEISKFTESCEGAGLIGCVSNKDMADAGYNGAYDCLEVYCIGKVSRVCLSGEKCPWRDDDNMKSSTYSKGFQLNEFKGNTKDMTCSPFGLKLQAKSTGAVKMAWMAYTEQAPFHEIDCDVNGKMTFKGAVGGPPAASSKGEAIPKFGEVCGLKPRPCKPGSICGATEKRTYASGEEMMMNNANFVHAGPCH